MTGTYKIADRVFLICTIWRDTHMLCREYQFMSNHYDYVVEITEDDIAFERAKADRESQIEGLKPVQFSDGYLETLAVYRKIADALLSEGCIVFHGSAVAVDGVGYIVTAKSGTGKSTHVRLWRELLGDNAVMINDDKPILRIEKGSVTVYGTPWMGKHSLGNNISVPVKAIAILQRGIDNEIIPMSPAEAWPMLLQQSYRSNNPATVSQLLSLVDKLSSSVLLFGLKCNMELAAAQVAYEKMSR